MMNLGSPSTTGVNQQDLEEVTSQKIVMVRTPSDFPTPVGGESSLEDNTLYYCDWTEFGSSKPTMDISFALRFPNTNSTVRITGRNGWNMQFRYTGTGSFLRGSATVAGQEIRLRFNDIAFTGDDVLNVGGKNQRLYDFQGTDGKYRIHETTTSHRDWYDLGIIEGATFDSIHSGFLGNNNGITFKGNGEIILQNPDYEGGVNVSALKPAMINTEGVIGTFQIAEMITQIGTNETLFDLQHTHTGGLSGGTFMTGTIIQGEPNIFTPTSNTNKTNNHIFLGNGVIPDSSVNGSIFWSNNSTSTTVTTQNVWVKVAGTTIFESEDLERVSVPQDNRLQFSLESEKILTTHINISAISSNQTPRLEFTIFLNGVQILKSGQPVVFEFEVNTVDPVTGGITIPLQLNDGDYIELYGRNMSNIQDFTVVNGAIITN